jgi:hypothetical protein
LFAAEYFRLKNGDAHGLERTHGDFILISDAKFLLWHPAIPQFPVTLAILFLQGCLLGKGSNCRFFIFSQYFSGQIRLANSRAVIRMLALFIPANTLIGLK